MTARSRWYATAGARVISAVVTDLDGTVVDGSGRVSPATERALSLLAERGIPLLVATARTPSWLEAAESLVRWVTVAACCGGAVGWSPRARTILWRDTIAPGTVELIVQSSLAWQPAAGVAVYDGVQWRMTEAFAATGPARVGPRLIVSLVQIPDEPVCVMSVCHPSLGPGGGELPVLNEWPLELAAAYAAGRVDLAPGWADKAAGVARALAEVSVDPVDAIAFGDAPPDLPMFELCGHSVAMADGNPDVIAAATLVAPGLADDGFAETLARLGLISDPGR